MISRKITDSASVGDRFGHNEATETGDVEMPLGSPQWAGRKFKMAATSENPGFGLPTKLNDHCRGLLEQGMMAQVCAGESHAFSWVHSERLWDGAVPFTTLHDKSA